MLDGYLKRRLRAGDLEVTVAGRSRRYGDGTGTPVAVRLSPAAALAIALDPELKLGECYMDGSLAFLQGDLYGLLEILGRNAAFRQPSGGILGRMRRRAAWRRNDRGAARRNVAHHYDLSFDLYRRFLDADMQYSCAYFRTPGLTLEAAQAAKEAHIAAKLDLPERGRVLDIGCGWGGLALSLARAAPGLEVVGVTLSPEQLQAAERRAEAEGLSERVRFRLQDYRDVEPGFDRIVSVGMFEHVGRANYDEFFRHVARLLTPGGAMLLHAIGRHTPPKPTQPFIAKYIFPGGYIPSLSEVLPAVEAAGLWVADLEVLRLHYADTLAEWRRRFLADRAAIAGLYDERFCRMWEYYLVASEAGFRWFGMMVFQMQLCRRQDALPLTRDYMAAAEARLLAPAAAGGGPAAAG